jgi:hypothetical protein
MPRTQAIPQLDGDTASRIRATLADVPADRKRIGLPKPQPVEQLSRCNLRPAPVNSAKHLEYRAAQRYDVPSNPRKSGGA